MGGRIVCRTAGDGRRVMTQADIVECNVVGGEMKVGIELSDRLAVGGCVLSMDLALRLRAGAGAGKHESEVRCTGDGNVIARQRCG